MEESVSFSAGHHVMQLYESQHSRARSVADFFARALRQGDPAVMISTHDRYHSVVRNLRSRPGFSMDAGRRIQLVDARAALALVMDGGEVNDARLQQLLDDLFTSARGRQKDRTLWVYGDAVDLLCQQCNHEAATRLEELANPVISSHQPMAALCGYSAENFANYDEAPQLRSVCIQHTHIVPVYRSANGSIERPAPEPIAVLRQRIGTSGGLVPGDAPSQSRKLSESAPTIFLIDDEDSVRRALARLLAQLMLPVHTYASAEEFLAKTEPTARGCLIVDVHLTGMKGTELQSLLEHEHWSLPVIAISGSHDRQVESEALQLGAKAFLYKPFDAAALINAARGALAGMDATQKEMSGRPTAVP
jgi:CheY-like chemotaxis protein